jgi:hypothetical protein
MSDQDSEGEDIERYRDDGLEKIEKNKITKGVVNCFPLYVWVWPNGKRR